MKIVLADEANEDLKSTLRVIAEHNPFAARGLRERVRKTLRQLARRDFEGPEIELISGGRCRSWPVPPLRIYYQRRSDALHVVRIYHHARRPITKE
jgi:plasmid stabilization system protein ParE